VTLEGVAGATDDEDMADVGEHIARIRELADAVEEQRSPRYAPRTAPVPLELLALCGAAPRADRQGVTEAPSDAPTGGVRLLQAFVDGVLWSLAALACLVVLGVAALQVLPSSPRPAVDGAVAIHDASGAQP